MKFSSLPALEVVKWQMTTSSAASDENFIKMTFHISAKLYSMHLYLMKFIFDIVYMTIFFIHFQVSVREAVQFDR